MGSLESSRDETRPIAVIGLSGTFPGEATTPEKLWEMCSKGENAWSPIPKDRFNSQAFYHPDGGRDGSSNVRGAYFLQEDLASFDGAFFGLNAAEAAALDPQQRLLLKSSYEALENAGMRMEDIAGQSVGVFVGTFCKDWGNIMVQDPDAIPMYFMTGAGYAMLSNRLSYFYNLSGPSLTIDTACSASLVSLHLACQSLRAGDCSSAIVAGVSCMLDPDQFVTLSSIGFLSPDGKSYSFDERGNGYARGEGVACVILKPLDEALKDGDNIRAIIRNSGINQDGKTPGVTFPNAKAQESLARKVYSQAGLNPLETTYVETHGTGTQAGDPVEASALYATFGKGRTEPLQIGSIKTNIGHLEGASGVTGLIKTILMLEREQILPNCDFKTPNKRIPMNEWNLKVPTYCSPWARKNGVLRASVSSFGYAGTNAHVILEDARGYLNARELKEYSPTIGDRMHNSRNIEILDLEATSDLIPAHLDVTQTNEPTACTPTRSRLYVLSAHDEIAGKEYAARLSSFLQNKVADEEPYLERLEVTLSEHRSLLTWRSSVVASSFAELIDGLQHANFKRATKPPTIGFVFTGQGAQWYAMARSLLDMSEFRKSLDLSGEVIKYLGADWSVIEELLRDESSTRVNEAILSQPLCTIIQVALVDLLRSWGIVPNVVVGHSSGEIAASYAAGSLDLKTAVTTAYYRGLVVGTKKRQTESFKGAMAALRGSHAEVTSLLCEIKTGTANIACHNSPNSFTVSGDENAIQELVKLCSSKDVWARKLLVDVAYHSPQMQAVANDYFAALLAAFTNSRIPQSERCEQFSSVTGHKLLPGEVGPGYWVDNLTQSVQFSDALIEMCTKAKGRALNRTRNISSIDLLIEIGPHAALAGPVREIIQSQASLSKVTYLPTLKRQEDSVISLLCLASKLYDSGYSLNIKAVNGPFHKHASFLTNLPRYPWNRTTKYWAEPRLHVEYRQRKWPRHDLLGAPVKFGNTLEPRWRNWIRLSELPWLRDHRVQSLVVYPAAGYISMAIEAARQRAVDRNLSIDGYDLREINLSQALVISDPVETMFCMKPYSESSKSSSGTWNEFFVYSASSKGEWIEHCRGQISVRQSAPTNLIDGESQKERSRRNYARQRHEADAYCTRIIQGTELYAKCTKIGLEYGPLFANLIEARVGKPLNGQGSSSIGTVIHPDIEKIMPANYQSDCVIHPTLLDALFHVAIAGSEGLKSAFMPTFLSRVFVSHELSSKPQSSFSAYANIDSRGQRNLTIDVDVYDDVVDSALPSVEVRGLQMTSLSSHQAEGASGQPRKSYYRTKLRPDVSLLSPDNFWHLCNHLKSTEEEDRLGAMIDEAFYYLAAQAIKQIPQALIPTLPGKGTKLYRSLERVEEFVRTRQLQFNVSSWICNDGIKREEIIEKVRRSGDEGNFVVCVGEQLPGIMLGKVDPLTLTMEGDILGRYYANNSRMAHQQGAVLVDHLAHKNPHLRVLEIGSGTGGATLPILTVLGGINKQSPPRFISYDITDITTGFFDKLQQKTAIWGDLVSYKKLDIEKDPIEQGFESEQYDLIVAANVLHATVNMIQTMGNVRKLLKPDGTLLLIELMPQMTGVTNIFGIFDGWWMGEEEDRKISPLMSETTWNDLLIKTGFSGLDFMLPDTADIATHQGTTMVSRATAFDVEQEEYELDWPSPKLQVLEKVVLVTTTESSKDKNLAKLIKELSELYNLADRIEEVVDLQNLQTRGRFCILLETEKSILNGMTETSLQALNNVFSDSKGVLWVTSGASYQSKNPELSLVSGFLRTLRVETGRALIHLDLDPSPVYDTNAVTVIAKIYQARIANGIVENEYIERGGVIMIPRHLEDDDTGIHIAARTGNRSPKTDLIPQAGRALKLQIAEIGLLDTFYFDDDLGVADMVPTDHIEIEVKASALNFRDIMMTMGQIETTALGYEGSGVVTKVGQNVQSFKIGDRVMAAGDGTFASFFRVHHMAAFKIPDWMSFEEAAAIPVAYGTAFHSLKAARLSTGDTVLIHTATGALGQALIMMCQNVGARILTTVGTVEKKSFLMSNFGFPEEQIFYSRDSSFKQGIMNATDGKGVDVIFNSLSSELQRVTWECIAPFGRFIELGRRDFMVNSRLEQSGFLNNVTFVGLDYRHISNTRSEYVQEAFHGYMELIEQKRLTAPQPISIYGLGDVEKAFRTMQSGKHIGKIVVVAKDREYGMVMPKQAPRPNIKADASYILVGGMGGIGRAIAIRLVELGARGIAFLSRSGAGSSAAVDLLKQLENSGVTVKILKCDIGNTQQVEACTKDIEQSMPPIKGVLHLAMVMRSAMFKNMSLDDWNESLFPKVQGTWNLHNLLPKDLDFFVLVSSFVGIIGNASQAAYSAASSFQDAFSTYRNQLGLPATTIDLGLITEIGYVADRELLDNKLRAQGYDAISAEECLAIIEEAISQPFQSEHGGSLISGLGLGRFTGGDLHHASHQAPISSHVRRLALIAFSGNTANKESAVSARARELLRNAKSLAEAEGHITDAIRLKLSSLMMLPLSDIDSARPLSYYGLDSLVAVEMRNWIASEIEATVPVLELLGNQSLLELAKSITRQSRIINKTLK